MNVHKKSRLIEMQCKSKKPEKYYRTNGRQIMSGNKRIINKNTVTRGRHRGSLSVCCHTLTPFVKTFCASTTRHTNNRPYFAYFIAKMLPQICVLVNVFLPYHSHRPIRPMTVI